jgi:hypothetical protein
VGGAFAEPRPPPGSARRLHAGRPAPAEKVAAEVGGEVR